MPAREGDHGATLAGALRGAVPPLPWAVWIGRQAAAQLDHAHRLGVVHGRVSLAAFMLVDTPLGEEVVLDVDPTAPPSPEPQRPSVVASDLWGLGEVLYHLVTGAPPPFDPLGERAPGPSRQDGLRLPDVVSAVVLRLLSRRPQERPGAGEVALAFARAERELASTNEPGLSWERGSLVRARYRLLHEDRARPSALRFVAADEREQAARRLLRIAPNVSERGLRLIEAEWERLRAVDDPHVERILELVRCDGGHLVAVADAPRSTSLTSVTQPGALPALADARRLLAGVARGLAALHAVGAHFSGLEADDVVLAGEAPHRAVIVHACDAAAERISFANDDALHRAVYRLALAPEALLGFAPTSPRSDLYDLGGVAYRLLAGREPFDAKPGSGQLKAHLHQKPLPLTQVPGDLADLVAALLEKDPARRPVSAAAVAEAFEVRD